MVKKEHTLVRVQLDVSKQAKRNLRIFSIAADLSVGEALDQILTQHLPQIAKNRFGIVLTSNGEDGHA